MLQVGGRVNNKDNRRIPLLIKKLDAKTAKALLF
jgi:hypothetical protein